MIHYNLLPKENIIKKPLGIKAYKVFSNRVKATIFFEKEQTEEQPITDVWD